MKMSFLFFLSSSLLTFCAWISAPWSSFNLKIVYGLTQIPMDWKLTIDPKSISKDMLCHVSCEEGGELLTVKLPIFYIPALDHYLLVHLCLIYIQLLTLSQCSLFSSKICTFMKIEKCTISIPKGNSYCRRKSSARWPRFKVSSEVCILVVIMYSVYMYITFKIKVFLIIT